METMGHFACSLLYIEVEIEFRLSGIHQCKTRVVTYKNFVLKRLRLGSCNPEQLKSSYAIETYSITVLIAKLRVILR